MPIEKYITEVFYLIEDYWLKALQSKRLRMRGLQPALQDSRIIIMGL